MTSWMVITSRMYQWAIRSEAPLQTGERQETVRVGMSLGLDLSNIQSGPCESSAECEEGPAEMRDWRAPRTRRPRGVWILYANQLIIPQSFHRSVGEPAEGSLPRDPNPTSQHLCETQTPRARVPRDAAAHSTTQQTTTTTTEPIVT